MSFPRLVITALLAMMALTMGSSPAYAHAELVSTSPTDGSSLSSVPDQVSFTFNENLLAGSTTIAFVDSTGTVISSSPGVISGTTITSPWPAAASTGQIQVSYRVVSADSHPITGTMTVTLSATDAPSESAATPLISPNTEVDPQSSPSIWLILLAVACITAAIALIVVSRTRSRARRPRRT